MAQPGAAVSCWTGAHWAAALPPAAESTPLGNTLPEPRRQLAWPQQQPSWGLYAGHPFIMEPLHRPRLGYSGDGCCPLSWQGWSDHLSSVCVCWCVAYLLSLCVSMLLCVSTMPPAMSPMPPPASAWSLLVLRTARTTGAPGGSCCTRHQVGPGGGAGGGFQQHLAGGRFRGRGLALCAVGPSRMATAGSLWNSDSSCFSCCEGVWAGEVRVRGRASRQHRSIQQQGRVISGVLWAAAEAGAAVGPCCCKGEPCCWWA